VLFIVSHYPKGSTDRLNRIRDIPVAVFKAEAGKQTFTSEPLERVKDHRAFRLP